MPDVVTHSIPERHMLCLKRTTENEQAVWDLGKEFIGIMKERPMPRVDGPFGASVLIYYGEVNADSNGPVEWCRPIPAEGREEIAAQYPELCLRTEPAHEEAWMHVGQGDQISPARWKVVSDTLGAWAEEHRRFPSGLGMRIVYEFAPSGPDCSFAVPLT